MGVKGFISVFIFSLCSVLQSQVNSKAQKELENNIELKNEFNDFFNLHIKQPEINEFGEIVYYQIDQINAVNYFDYNFDGKTDALVEFSSSASDGGTSYFLTAALFESDSVSYNYVAHLYPKFTMFNKFNRGVFYFDNAISKINEEVLSKMKYTLSIDSSEFLIID
ncbi:hypothetical protein [Pseudotamlana agarivorans]|uniref:hypothetical protein n=1 Tax=Pseudotamlana agarivorans TaxID=481183 RepID=UPI00082C737E|nr:hypothetical protein [Tamlana agarivorans]